MKILVLLPVLFLFFVSSCTTAPVQRDCPVVDHSHDTERNSGLDRDEISCVINNSVREARQCYELELDETPSLKARYVSKFEIAPDGSVISSISERTDGPPIPRFASCLDKKMSALKYPPHKGAVKVSWPWMFKRSGTGSGTQSVFDN